MVFQLLVVQKQWFCEYIDVQTHFAYGHFEVDRNQFSHEEIVEVFNETESNRLLYLLYIDCIFNHDELFQQLKHKVKCLDINYFITCAGSTLDGGQDVISRLVEPPGVLEQCPECCK